MVKNLIRVCLVLLSVGVAFKVKKGSFLRYLPVGLFSVVLSLLRFVYLDKREKMSFAGGARESLCTMFITVLGPHFWFTLLTFDKSKGNLMVYSLLTMISCSIYTFVVVRMLTKLRFVKYQVNLNTLFGITLLQAYLNYFFQRIYEKGLASRHLVN